MSANAALITHVKAETSNFVSGMRKGKAELEGFHASSKRFSETWLKVPEHIGRMARGVAGGLTVAEDALSLFGVKAESTAGKAIDVASSIATGFATGGVIGAAITGVTSLLKVFGSTAEEEAKKAAAAQKEYAEQLKRSQEQMKALSEERAGYLRQLDTLNGGGGASERDARIQQLRVEIEDATRAAAFNLDLSARSSGEEAKRAMESHNAHQLRRMELEATLATLEEIEQKQFLNTESAAVEASLREKQVDYAERLKLHLKAILEDGKRRTDQLKEQDRLLKESSERMLEMAKKLDGGKTSIEVPDSLTRPAGGWTAGKADVEAAFQESDFGTTVEAEKQVAKSAKEAADSIKKQAEAAKETTDQLKQQQRLVGSRKQITERFANFGGSSLFGFGRGQAGTGLGDIGRDAAAAMRGATPFQRSDAFGAAMVPPLKSAADSASRIPAAMGKAVSAAQRLAGEMNSAVTRIGEAVARGDAALSGAIASLKARVKAAEDKIADARGAAA